MGSVRGEHCQAKQICSLHILLSILFKRQLFGELNAASSISSHFRVFSILQEKRLVEEELWRWGVMRYGWREEGLKGVPGEKVDS